MTAVTTALSIIEALTLSLLLSAGALHSAPPPDLPLIGTLLMGIPLARIGAAIGKAGQYMRRAG